MKPSIENEVLRDCVDENSLASIALSEALKHTLADFIEKMERTEVEDMGKMVNVTFNGVMDHLANYLCFLSDFLKTEGIEQLIANTQDCVSKVFSEIRSKKSLN